jgi:PAS domain-containing protein
MCSCLTRCYKRLFPDPAQPQPQASSKGTTQITVRSKDDEKKTKAIRERVGSVKESVSLHDKDIFLKDGVHCLSAELEYANRKFMLSFLLDKTRREQVRTAGLLTCIVDDSVDLNIVAVTDEGCTLSGISPNKLLAKSVKVLLPNQDLIKLREKSVQSVVLSVLQSAEKSEKPKEMKATLFLIQYAPYFVMVFNTNEIAKTELQNEMRNVRKVFDVITEKDVGKEGSSYYYNKEWNHPSKRAFQKVVLSMAAPLRNDKGFRLICNHNFEIMAVNQAALDFLGHQPQELFTINITELFSQESADFFFQEFDAQFPHKDFASCNEIEVVRKKGGCLFANFTVQKVEANYLFVIADKIVIPQPQEEDILLLPQKRLHHKFQLRFQTAGKAKIGMIGNFYPLP